MIQTGERPQTNGRTHGHYQTYYRPCYAVDKYNGVWHERQWLVLVAVIEPMTSSARLKLNMKPEQSGYIMPKVLVDVVFKEILVALAKSQV